MKNGAKVQAYAREAGAVPERFNNYIFDGNEGIGKFI